MKKGLGCAGALALGLVMASGGAAVAQETGLAGLHDWVRVGGRTCLLDHFHDGSGSGPTRAAAQRAAIQAWIDFTAWEYGSRWGSYGSLPQQEDVLLGQPRQLQLQHLLAALPPLEQIASDRSECFDRNCRINALAATLPSWRGDSLRSEASLLWSASADFSARRMRRAGGGRARCSGPASHVQGGRWLLPLAVAAAFPSTAIA